MCLQEVVSLGVAEPLDPTALDTIAAPHVSPQEFHELIERAHHEQQSTVLLDVRNLYETRVGHFAKVCTTMTPHVAIA